MSREKRGEACRVLHEKEQPWSWQPCCVAFSKPLPSLG